MERNNIVEKKAVRRPRRVLEYWRGLILNLKTNMNFGTARNYRNSLYRFSEFLDRHDIAFSKIDADLVSDYELWLRKRGLKMNSVSFYLRCLRSVCNQAVSEGIARL
ncbi:MAG: phage integrase SAM-like domain-containing protein [Prevotella sp.]|nr:phage integrase SAM-like domain-containing protein [Prevotella sp.]MBS7208780.1 phage integrase SAM-like domain-containing protein [Prevotella sp.]